MIKLPGLGAFSCLGIHLLQQRIGFIGFLQLKKTPAFL